MTSGMAPGSGLGERSDDTVEAHHVAGSIPYLWPYDGDLSSPHLSLVVIGAQEAFVSASQRALEVTRTIGSLIAGFRSRGVDVVFVRHQSNTPPPVVFSRPRPASFLPAGGSRGWHLTLPSGEAQAIVDARGTDGFFESGLDGFLRSRRISHLCLAGFAGEVTVDHTLRGANDRGYECLVVSDGVAPLDTDTGARALASVTMSGGIFGALATAAEILAALEI